MYFDNVEFDKEKHMYTIGKQILTSSTTWISKFEKPFDADGIAKRKAERENLNAEELKKEWKKKGEVAREKGTRVHDYIDCYLSGKEFVFDGRLPEIDGWHKFWVENGTNLHPIYMEFVIGDLDYKLGGMVDLVAYSTKSNLFHPIDWKTGKSFTTQNDYGEKLKAPFDDLDACKIVTYSMQLSIYSIILRKNTRLPLGVPMIVYLDPEGNYESYAATDYTERILGVLQNDR